MTIYSEARKTKFRFQFQLLISRAFSICEGSQTAGDCICDAGYSPAYPASNACQTFACDGYCKNSGTCSFNTVTATPECTCSGDFFGATCEKTVCDGYNCNDAQCVKRVSNCCFLSEEKSSMTLAKFWFSRMKSLRLIFF